MSKRFERPPAFATKYDYSAAYHRCHAHIQVRTSRSTRRQDFASDTTGMTITHCPHCGRELRREEVLLEVEARHHPQGIGRALREFSKQCRRRDQAGQQGGSDA